MFACLFVFPAHCTNFVFFFFFVLYGSATWCLRENETAILRRTERAMVRAMCDAKLMEKKRTEDLMEVL